MQREYNVQVVTGAVSAAKLSTCACGASTTLCAPQPRVAYRETVLKKAAFEYQHKKQTGGAGQVRPARSSSLGA